MDHGTRHAGARMKTQEDFDDEFGRIVGMLSYVSRHRRFRISEKEARNVYAETKPGTAARSEVACELLRLGVDFGSL